MSILLLFVAKIPRYTRFLLALFLFCLGLDFVDTLIYWSEPVNAIVFKDRIYPFYVFKVSCFLAAPALYLYVKSMLFSDFKLSAKCYLHFLPAALFLFALPFFLQSHGSEYFAFARTDYESLFHDPAYQTYLLAKNIIFIIYGGCSYWLFIRYRSYIQKKPNGRVIDQFWLHFLMAGFLVIWVGYFSSHLSHLLYESQTISDMLGRFGNYFNVIFINTLFAYSLFKSKVFRGIDEAQLIQSNQKLSGEQQGIIVALLNIAMEEKKMYLDPELTLDQLAGKLGCSKKLVSYTINRKFKKNFIEYINEYRIACAKLLLADTGKTRPMLEVMEMSGFNSKSTFNRYFKRATRMTPSEFRESLNN